MTAGQIIAVIAFVLVLVAMFKIKHTCRFCGTKSTMWARKPCCERDALAAEIADTESAVAAVGVVRRHKEKKEGCR